MPSPFPGMDPFLEDPGLFPAFHSSMIPFLMEALQPLLPEPYFAQTGERVWVEMSERYVEPDVDVLRNESDSERIGSTPRTAATDTVGTKPIRITVPHDERREVHLEIYARQDRDNRLVTAIELLSPGSKYAGEARRELYLRKQEELLYSKVHLVEIDLLRGGEHTTAVPKERFLAEAGECEYHVCIHRFDRIEEFLVYPIRIREPLPVIAIPLLPGDGEVAISLQNVFDHCYDAGPYRRRIRYRDATPTPRLSPEDARWAADLIRGGAESPSP